MQEATKCCDILLTGARLLPIRPRKTAIFPGSLAISAGKIVGVGASNLIDRSFVGSTVLDCAGKIVLPGFVNSHVHAGMSLLKAYPCDKPLLERLRQVVWPFMEAIDAPSTYAATQLACLEFIQGGITTVSDMFPFVEATAQAIALAGLRAVVAPYMRGNGKGMANDIAAIRRHSDKGIVPAVGIQSLYESTREGLLDAAAFARSEGVPVHIHIAESQAETAAGNDVSRLVELGLMLPGTILAHAIHVTPCEVRFIHERGAGIAHNPSANAKLGTGIAAVGNYLAAGCMVGLGTDSVAANDRHDMFEEMRLAVLLSRWRTTKAAITAWDAIEMATLGGATVLGLDDRIGSIEIGKDADIIVVGIEGVHVAPLMVEDFDTDRLLAHLVFSAGAADIDTVIASGKVVMQGRRFLELEPGRIIAMAKQAAGQVLQRAGLA